MPSRAVRERGSVLALMPAAVLVFIVLGSLAVDASLAFLGEREVANVAAAVANDAATKGIDIEHFYATGEVVLDPALVDDVARGALATAGLHHLDDLTIEAEVVGVDAVIVRVRARVRSLFSKALPGGVESREVDAEAAAVAERG